MARYTKGGDVVRVPQINAELEKIEQAFENTLSRDGDAPNQMNAPIDMNGNKIVNVQTDITDPNSLVQRSDLYVKSEVDALDTSTLQAAKAYADSINVFEETVDAALLRSQLADVDSTVLVGGVEANNVGELTSDLYQKIEIRDTTNGTGDSLIGNPDKGNNIASDLNSCFISTGGYFPDENLIGFTKPSEDFLGDGSTKIFTTTFDAVNTSDIRVELVRSDGVRLGVTFKESTLIEIVGGKAQVTYPIDGRFVNNGTGGSEGTDAFLSANETLIISSTVATENVGSNANLCSIYGGYDNIIEMGIMQQVSGAHHRIKGGDHNTVVGGSYSVVNQGSYGSIFGGTNNKILDVGNSSGSGVFGGTGNEVDSAVGWVFGGSGNTTTGAFAVTIGGFNNVAAGNGSFVSGRDNTATGSDCFVGGKENVASAVYQTVGGLRNTPTGAYTATFGRGHTGSGAYAFAAGFENVVGADYSVATGIGAKTRFPAEQAFSGGKSLEVGDRQFSNIPLTCQTISATGVTLKAALGTNITIAAGEVWSFSCLIVGKRTDSTGETGGFLVKGVIENISGAASLVGTPLVENIGDATSTWSVSVDAIGNSLNIKPSGDAGKTVEWFGKLELAIIK